MREGWARSGAGAGDESVEAIMSQSAVTAWAWAVAAAADAAWRSCGSVWESRSALKRAKTAAGSRGRAARAAEERDEGAAGRSLRVRARLVGSGGSCAWDRRRSRSASEAPAEGRDGTLRWAWAKRGLWLRVRYTRAATIAARARREESSSVEMMVMRPERTVLIVEADISRRDTWP
jgi:hypothetical protein